MAELLTNFGRTTLASGCTDVATSISLLDGSSFPATGNFRVNCEDEIMLVTARATNTLTVQRGMEGTTAAAHSTGVHISQVATAGAVVELIDERTVPSKLFAYQNFR